MTSGHPLPYDVNCSILFTELPLPERAAAARAAGFDGVETMRSSTPTTGPTG